MIVDPETMEELNTRQEGMVLIGGVQVMQGYLNDDQRTQSVIVEKQGNRWYITGDKGHLDDDGFLTIVDRYSRFAKLGGEMISLGAVETTINAIVADPENEVVVVAIPDHKKGEALVALHQKDLDTGALKQKILGQGANPINIPAKWILVDELPKLGSGKTDFARAKALASEG